MPAPGWRFRSILGRFGVDVGTILGRFWDDLGFILGLFLKGFWRPFVAASVANYMTSLRMRTSQLQQKNSQLSKNMRFPSPQLADQVAHAIGCKSASFFRCFFGCVFGAFLGGFWGPFWSRFGTPKSFKNWSKLQLKSSIAFITLFDPSGGLRGQFLEPSWGSFGVLL